MLWVWSAVCVWLAGCLLRIGTLSRCSEDLHPTLPLVPTNPPPPPPSSPLPLFLSSTPPTPSIRYSGNTTTNTSGITSTIGLRVRKSRVHFDGADICEDSPSDPIVHLCGWWCQSLLDSKTTAFPNPSRLRLYHCRHPLLEYLQCRTAGRCLL